MTKEEVIKILAQEQKPADKYNELVSAYKASKNPNRLFLANVSRNIYTKTNLDTLVYEVKKAYGIKDLEVHLAIKNGVVEKSADALPPKDTIKPPKPKGIDELQIVTDSTEPLKMREEFKRLNAKDVPDLIAIAVQKKMNTYATMQEITKKLHELEEAKSEDEDLLSNLAKELVEATEENDLLHQELKHWDETGEFLGKHDLFWQTAINKEVEKMNGVELAKEIEAARKYIGKHEKELNEKDFTDEKKAEIEKKIEQRKYKMKLAENKLAAK